MESINSLFPNLIDGHKNILLNYLEKIKSLIIVKFGMNDKQNAFNDMLMENNMDSYKGLVLLLLPFVDNMINAEQIQSLNDLYIKKESAVDINKSEPRYNFSNLQYNRCNRNGSSATEIKFSEEHLKHNFYLLRETIQIIANKMYVNWINIRPRSLKDYQRSKIYEETYTAITTNTVPLFNPMSDVLDDYSGIYIGDIYDVLSNHLFHNIVSIKWLIYNVNENGNVLPMYYLINSIFDLTDITNDISWNQSNKTNKEQFTKTWTDLQNAIKNGDSYKNITNQSLEPLCRAMTLFFNLTYRHDTRVTKSGYTVFKLPQSNEDALEQATRVNTHNDIIFASMYTISADKLYEYLKLSFGTFKRTWYSRRIDHKYTEYQGDDIGLGIINSSKLFYNFAKSMTHTKENISLRDGSNKNRYFQYSRYWRSLSNDDKEEFRRRLSMAKDANVTGFFNLKRYLKYLYGNIDFDVANSKIYDMIKDELAKIIYDIMATNGILSEFVLSKELTDKSLRKNKEYLNKKLDELVFNDDSKWKESFYFLTGKSYSDQLIKTKDSSNNLETKKYLDADTMSAKSPWYDFITMNWVTQIGFFHRYLNNRIMYVTGGTGAGKTSQMPKLLLYALKMIDSNDDGKIIMSQPRRALVSGNTESISYQMGVPIKEYNEDFKDNVVSDNYNLQYKHGDGGHTRKQNGLTLQLVTDRILYDALRESPLLRERGGNKYDIVVIDESHEHNENMDLILTLMRYAAYYNNSLKLVIISATMEMDEPVYRRYYRDVNDNRMHPFNHLLEENNLDRINVDRRLHLASPNDLSSGGVRYKIDEFSMPNKQANEIVMDIANKSSDGDILMFQPGKREIMESRDFLNKNLPPNFIALPLFSELPKRKLEFITTNFNVKNYLLPRDVPYESKYNESEIKKVQPGTYTRAVIISTNLAEASLTISSLRYVVDTGTEKSMIYNYNVRSSGINVSQISESSRKQRKGRVGRVAPGSVYYTYNLEETKNIKQKFSISITDISELIYSLLRENCNDKELFGINNDPHNANLSIGAINNLYSSSVIQNMIEDQYFYKGNFISYYGNDNYYDYNNKKSPPSRSTTGYSHNILTDSDGSFYIVHPEEVNFDRNILGQIVESSDLELENGKIKSSKIESFWNVLQERMLVFDDVSCKNDVSKTIYGTELLFLKGRLKTWELPYILAFLYSRNYGVSEEIKLLIPMYKLLNGQMSKLAYVSFENGQEVNHFDKLVHAYGTCFGDSCSLVDAINHIFDGLSGMGGDLKMMITSLKARLNLGKDYKVTDNSNIITMKGYYLNKEYEKIDIDTFNKLKKLDDTNRLNKFDKNLNESEKRELVKEDVMVINPSIILENNEAKISDWCKRNHFSIAIVRQYIRQLFVLLNEVYKYENKIYDEDIKDKGVNLAWFDKKLTNIKKDSNNKKCENITRVFLTSFPSNIVKRIEGSNLFLPILNPAPQNTFGIGGVSGHPVIKNVLMKQNCYPDYLLHLFSNYERNTISYLHKVTPKTIQEIVPFLYLPSKFQYGYYDETAQKKAIEYLTSQLTLSLEPKDTKRKLSSKLVTQYVKTVKQIKKDMLQNYNPRVYEDLQNLSDDPNFSKSMSELTKNQTKIKRNMQTGGNLQSKYSGNLQSKYSGNLSNKYSGNLSNKEVTLPVTTLRSHRYSKYILDQLY